MTVLMTAVRDSFRESRSITESFDVSDVGDDPSSDSSVDVSDHDGPLIDREFFSSFDHGSDFELIRDVDVFLSGWLIGEGFRYG